MFYDRLNQLCQEKGVAVTKVIELCGFSTGNQSKWKKKDPDLKRSTLTTIADYFDVSIDYLVGRSEKRTLGMSSEIEDKYLLALIECFNKCTIDERLSIIQLVKNEVGKFEAERKKAPSGASSTAVG